MLIVGTAPDNNGRLARVAAYQTVPEHGFLVVLDDGSFDVWSIFGCKEYRP